jgi:hypothetical protein
MTAIADSLANAPAQRAEAGAARAFPVLRVPVPLDQWDDVAAGFDGLCQEQLMAFAGIRWPGTTPETMVFKSIGGEVVGGALVIIQHLPLGLGSIAITKWGPMLADTRRADAASVYAGMIDALLEEYSKKRGMMLSVLTRAASGEENDEYWHLMARGFKPGALLNYPLRYLVKLRLSDAEQRKSLEQKWRYQLGKAEKQGLTFEHGGAERLDEFTALYERMLDRKRFTDHSAYHTIPHLLALKQQARPELFFVRKDGEVIAGAIIFKGGDRAVYLYGATLDNALPLRAGYFLHWNIIRWLRDNTTADWYDLGGSDGFAGLHQFKKGMVGSAGSITPVPRTANYAHLWLAFLFGSSALWAREGFHEVLRRLTRLRKDVAQPTLPRHVVTPSDVRL